MKFQKIFKELLDDKGMSARKLGQVIGIDNASIYTYLQGALPNLENAVKLANYFDCTLNYLFGLDIYPDEFLFTSTFNSNVFYERYEALLKEKSLSQYQLWKETGLSPSCRSFWRQGKIPKMETLIKVAKFLNVSIDYLVGRSAG